MKKAPTFCLNDQEGKQHCLSHYKGKWVLLYFYPKDDTPGCTKEACMIRDSWDAFEKHNAVVLGVSRDSEKSHKRFQEKYDLPFPLLSDKEGEVVMEYGVWKEKSMFGKKYMGISRESFLIDPEGNIAKHYEKVTPAVHAEEVLADLKELS